MPRGSTLAWIARGALLGAAAGELGQAADRFRARADLYARARIRAAALGRPLVVVGDPDGGWHTRFARAYGCGDLTIDLHGAPGCPRAVTADLAGPPIAAVPADSAVVYVSATLEYVADLPRAWREVLRMAGDPANVFVVRVGAGSASTVLYPGAAWVIDAAPPDGRALVARRVTPGAKLAWAGALAALAWLAWPTSAARAPRR